MKGDRVETAVDADGTTRTYEVVASRADHRVGTAVRRGVAEVSEVTRRGRPDAVRAGGTVVRTARSMAATRVLAHTERTS
ncbi:hypothetical protein QUY26_33320 [Streptomyces flavofungini]|nr:hypothetical protein [Streptomyces flavofungini]WJV49979.1 hypothetical protein QUY26_33320 [Streptomyces flavofungini]